MNNMNVYKNTVNASWANVVADSQLVYTSVVSNSNQHNQVHVFSLALTSSIVSLVVLHTVYLEWLSQQTTKQLTYLTPMGLLESPLGQSNQTNPFQRRKQM